MRSSTRFVIDLRAFKMRVPFERARHLKPCAFDSAFPSDSVKHQRVVSI